MNPTAPVDLAAVAPRIAALLYEVLLLAAVLWCAGFIYAMAEWQVTSVQPRLIFQLYLVAVAGVYFVWHWTRGQTLAMRTWRLRLVTRSGDVPALSRAIVRYVAAIASVLLIGFGFLWAFVDRERQFLHDRVAGTRIVRC